MLLAILAPFVTQILYQTSSFSSDEKFMFVLKKYMDFN
jgi:hypothetical protein